MYAVLHYRKLWAQSPSTVYRHRLRARRALMLCSDVLLRTRMALSPCRLSTVIAPFWFSAEQSWILFKSFWLSTEDIILTPSVPVILQVDSLGVDLVVHNCTSSAIRLNLHEIFWICAVFCTQLDNFSQMFWVHVIAFLIDVTSAHLFPFFSVWI